MMNLNLNPVSFQKSESVTEGIRMSLSPSSPKLSRSGSALAYHQMKAKVRSLSGTISSTNVPSGSPTLNTGVWGTGGPENHTAFISLDSAVKEEAVKIRSRVPDILMINKFYGLIPQKFTISSRKTTGSANCPRRTSKTHGGKPRAKSSTHFHPVSSTNGSHGETKGHRSENDSPDPIKMIFGCKRGSTDSEASNVSVASDRDPFGPVTRKMSMEKYKKWKAANSKRGLSFLHSQLPDGSSATCHAKNRSKRGQEDTEHLLENRRVIKIDLNTVSWDEENHYGRNDIYNNNEQSNELDKCGTIVGISNKVELVSPAGESKGNGVGERSICLLNNKINSGAESGRASSISANSNSSGESIKEEAVQSISPGLVENVSSSEKGKCSFGLDPPIDKNEAERKTQSDEKRPPAKLSMKTISLDDHTLDTGDSSGVSGRSEPSIKRRPTTAFSNSSSSGKSTFHTPNTFNPPSKVIPWTQRESTGGRPLTLAERRAKFQRAPSIHSSSSMEMGEEAELSAAEEIESSEARLAVAAVPSVAFRESRKPLHVIQPPEIATLMSQNNPNADEDILIEIEKVAIMLRKTQSLQHFSRSLDSGIESGSREEEAFKGLDNASSTSTLNDPNSGQNDNMTQEGKLSNSNTGSESSLTSEDSVIDNIDEDYLTGGEGGGKEPSKLRKSLSVPSSVPSSSREGFRRRRPSNDKKLPSAPVNNQRSCGNSRKSSISICSPALLITQRETTTPATRRPPLKKAISISCEHELLRADAKGNEVNENGKSLRPKTAQTQTQARSVAGTRSTHSTNNNYPDQQLKNNANIDRSLSESQNNNSSANSSQGSRNRKILIKKALLEVNQAAAAVSKKKWGILGRPRTAPTSEKSSPAQSLNHLARENKNASITDQKRRPMKASPFPISWKGRMSSPSSGKISVVTGAGRVSNCRNTGTETMQPGPGLEEQGEKRAISEEPETNPRPETGESVNQIKQQRSPFRQSFSLDEGALLGFSKRSVGEGRMAVFERMSEEGIDKCTSESGSSISLNILNDEISFLSSQKREQCLKIYEKMMKTGCSIKLDTIFRGMLTPSEYRAFMKAAEKATQELEDDEDNDEEESEDVIVIQN